MKLLKFQANSFWDVIKHLLILMVLVLASVLFFFYVYLPTTTNHGESITVPNLEGISVEDLNEFLLKRDLRFEISDSSYSYEYPPLTVLRQFPKPGAKVKEDRKI